MKLKMLKYLFIYCFMNINQIYNIANIKSKIDIIKAKYIMFTVFKTQE